jgi:hypothetical protein
MGGQGQDALRRLRLSLVALAEKERELDALRGHAGGAGAMGADTTPRITLGWVLDAYQCADETRARRSGDQFLPGNDFKVRKQ